MTTRGKERPPHPMRTCAPALLPRHREHVLEAPPDDRQLRPVNTKGYSSTYLAMGFANVRAGTQVEYPFVLLGGLTCLDWHAAGACVCSSELLLARSSVSNSEKWNIIISNCDYGGHIIISQNVGIINDIKRYIIVAANGRQCRRAARPDTANWTLDERPLNVSGGAPWH